MQTEAAKTEDQIQDKRALALQSLKDSIVASQDDADARAFGAMEDVVKTASGQTTLEQRNVIDAAEVVAPAPEPKRYYGSAGRTLPAQLMDVRYRGLPNWQQEFRNADDDMTVARYFRALRHKDVAGIARLMDDDRNMRATGDPLLEGTSTAGAPFSGTAGQLLPLPVHNMIQIAFYRMARWRGLVNVQTATVGNSLRWPRQNAISSSAWVAEKTGIASGEPNVATPLNLVLKKLATLADLSNEIIDDEVFGIVGWLLDDVVPQMAETEDVSEYADGDGTLEPNGFEANDVIITATTDDTVIVPTVTQAANHFLPTVIDEDNVTDLWFSIPEPERKDAIWTGNDFVMSVLSKMKDGGGRPIFNLQNSEAQIVGDAESSAAIGSIYRRPVFNLPGAAGTGALGIAVDANENRLYLLNPRRTYGLLEKPNVRIEASTENLFDEDATRYRFIRRADGGVIGNTIPTRHQFRFIGGITGAGTPA